MSRYQDSGTFRVLNADSDPAVFFRALPLRRERLLLLDYDGTLAPFTPARERAFPYPGVREALRRIVDDGRTRMIVVSGRAVRDLAPLLGIDPLPEIWGSHGWERQLSDGTYQGPEFPGGLRELFDAEWQWLTDHLPHSQIERKPASVAVHWRGLSDDARDRIRTAAEARWAAFEEMDLLELHAFDGGLELRAAGRTKGDAVHAILEGVPTETPVAYLGDDRTDEDAFAALEERTRRGVALRALVRAEARPTRADIHLIPPEELLLFLAYWMEVA